MLPPDSGVTPSGRPPVRLFIGTEPGQHRAERVLVWSIERVRDRSRAYEIHLMKELAGYDRTRWLTGFTNYRFLIPHFAGGRGRAIYNDVDQVYLTDPAELFDTDMNGHGFLAISERDTSVMLIDCERMAPVWTPELSRTERRKAIERRARDLWGPLDRAWNARDLEYAAGRSRVLHFTTIHTQPWQPFPELFVYQDNPVGEVWHELERGADATGFQVFDLERPSAAFRERLAQRREQQRVAPSPPAEPGTAALLRDALAGEGPRTILAFRLGGRSGGLESELGREATVYDPVESPEQAAPTGAFDAVVSFESLQHLGEEDVGWVVHGLFRRARRLVFATVTEESDDEVLPDGTTWRRRPRDRFWWFARFEEAARSHPDVHWRLVLRKRRRGGGYDASVRQGGRRAAPPTVWVLADDKAGHTTQSVGLAERLGWPYEVKQLRFRRVARVSNRLRGASRLGLDARRSDPLAPPWPDLVISTGRWTAPVARWIGVRSQGRTRLVQLGRKGGDNAAAFDLAVTCAHFRLPSHPRRVDTLAPLSAVTEERLAAAAQRWKDVFAGARAPRVGLVVGGTSALHRLDAETARRLAAEVSVWVREAGGSLFAITSPRTGREATEALRAGLGGSDHLHVWRKGERDNPYLGFLAVPDVLVVTGESESMLAEAVATGKPVYIYPLPERPPGVRLRLSRKITERAYSRPRKDKGTIRPQQRSEYVCARLIERGVVRPPRDLARLHEGLIAQGLAYPFGAPLRSATGRPPLREIELVAERVRGLFGLTEPASPDDSAQPRIASAG